MAYQKDASSPGADLEDMQSLLYLTEEADSQNRSGRLGLALKKYLAIQKVTSSAQIAIIDLHAHSGI